jgi:hypothetical protein
LARHNGGDRRPIRGAGEAQARPARLREHRSLGALCVLPHVILQLQDGLFALEVALLAALPQSGQHTAGCARDRE